MIYKYAHKLTIEVISGVFLAIDGIRLIKMPLDFTDITSLLIHLIKLGM